MKKLFQALSLRAKNMLEMDLATSDRPTVFRVVVITLLFASVLFISYCMIKEIPNP